MSPSTEEWIGRLSGDLRAVTRLPRLRAAFGWIAGSAAALVALAMGIAALAGPGALKHDLRPVDAVGAAAHLALAAGALAYALAACVPGRERARRAAARVAAGGAAGTALAAAWLLFGPAPWAAGPGLASGAVVCTLEALWPALPPALLLTAFAARGAPHRPGRVLLAGAVAALGFGTLPGHLGCPDSAAAHTLLGHLLAPLSGGLLIFGVARLFHRPSLPPIRG